MPTLEEVRFRDCPHCGVKTVAMDGRWAQTIASASREMRGWAVFTCPRCAGLTAIELEIYSLGIEPNTSLSSQVEVGEIRALPESGSSRYRVSHLPEDVARYFSDAQRVIDAGVPDAAAVQLRRTLEAAAAHKGIKEKTLVKSVQALIQGGFITQDFSPVLHHVRKVGNQGAHYTDESLDESEVQRALRFTTQVLRNLFEVPGELAELRPPDDERIESTSAENEILDVPDE